MKNTYTGKTNATFQLSCWKSFQHVPLNKWCYSPATVQLEVYNWKGGGQCSKLKHSSTVKRSLWPVAISISAAEHISPGVFGMGNTAMRTLCILFIMYEHKCYKLQAVKTAALYLYRVCRCSFGCKHSEILKKKFKKMGCHEYQREREKNTTKGISLHTLGEPRFISSDLILI